MSLWTRLEEPDVSDEVREEIRFYLEMRAKEFEASGLDPASARREAVRAFGDPDEIRRRMMREARMTRWTTAFREWVGSMAQDLRIALRSYRREPLFTLVAVTTLALGIGASTAIFSVAREALLAAPAVRDVGELAAVYTTCRNGTPRCSSSYPDFLDYRDRTDGIRDLAATALISASLGSEDQGAQLLTVQTVTGNFFDLLGLVPAEGRLLSPADDEFGGGAPVAVLSHELWRTHFAADPGVVGSTIRLNGRAFQVVGVAPADFDGLRINLHPELWVPMQSRPYLTGGDEDFTDRFEVRGSRWIDLLVARLAPGTSPEAARAELLALSTQMQDEDPDARGPRSVTLDPLKGYILPPEREADLRTFVLLLGGTVGLALLLCCANLANLLLARASGRRRDVGVRRAMGADRGRIVRQLATESVVLAALGGLAGLVVADALMRVLSRFDLPGGVPIASLDLGLDGGALLLTGLVTLGTAVLFGLAPALQGSRTDLSQALTSGRSTRDDHRSTRARKALVAVQIALSLVLLIGSGLFVRTLRAGLATDLGFRPEGVAALRYNLDLVGYQTEDAWSFVRTFEDRLRAAPGVESVTTATRVPLQDGGALGLFFDVNGYQPAPDEELRLDLVVTTPGFSETVGVPLLEGRDFNDGDAQGGERVALVSRGMAERYWPSGGAVGGLVTVSGTEFRVVGELGNTTWNGLDDEVTNYMYAPLAQMPSMAASRFLTVVTRSASPDAALGTMRSVLGSLDRDVSAYYARTMDDMVAGVLMPQRMGAVLLSAFGALALVLSVVGIAGVVAYAISRQRRDIAVRMALGASGDSILQSQVRSMVLPVLVGLAVGTGAALFLTRLIQGLLYRVSATDPLVYVVIAVVVVAVSAAAILVPARAATRLDPARVLGAE